MNGCKIRFIAKIDTRPQHNSSKATAKITPRISAPLKESAQIVQNVTLWRAKITATEMTTKMRG